MQKLVMAMTPCEMGGGMVLFSSLYCLQLESAVADISVAAVLEQPFSHTLQNKYYLPQLQSMDVLAVEHRKQLNGKPVTEDDIILLTSGSVKFHKVCLLRPPNESVTDGYRHSMRPPC